MIAALAPSSTNTANYETGKQLPSLPLHDPLVAAPPAVLADNDVLDDPPAEDDVIIGPPMPRGVKSSEGILNNDDHWPSPVKGGQQETPQYTPVGTRMTRGVTAIQEPPPPTTR